MLDNICWPLRSNIILRGKMGTFGLVRRTSNNELKPHQGWDLYAYPGITCHAVGDGKVVAARSSDTYGLLVDILLDTTVSGHKIYARYAHLSGWAANISQNERVTKGQIVGFTGNSGNARTMIGIHQHLHFEFMRQAWPGQGQVGLQQRYDPASIYGITPLNKVVRDTFLNKDWEPNDGRTMPHREEAKK